MCEKGRNQARATDSLFTACFNSHVQHTGRSATEQSAFRTLT